jgi:acyl-CoA thioester hydrolase
MTATWSSPVRYVECDQQGVVFNAHYLAWCDEAMNTWYAATGLAYPDLLARGLDARLVASTLEWSSPARWGDLVEVDVELERVGRTSFVLAFAVRVGERVCCRVRTTYVMTDAHGKPLPVPDDLRAAWTG